ncbi:MAG: GNAT family N-acetyltransferase [Clostridiales bacterium]|nr:GNAT family N-acetyltransferase [Clostridiales bacterium]
MVKIESSTHFKLWVSKAKENGFTLSNCYYTADKLAVLIGQERLMVLETPFAVLFLEKEDGFYRCCYYISPDRPIDVIRMDRPVVIEYIYKNKLSPKNQAELARLEQMGFTLGRKSARMTMHANEAACASNSSVSVEWARPGDEDAILALFSVAFDPLYAYFPEKDELTKVISASNAAPLEAKENALFCIYEGNHVCAALYGQRQISTASIRMLAAEPSSQGKGYGKALLFRYHQEFAANTVRFMHWVDSENQHAVQFYQKYGYLFDGCYAHEYVLR